MRVKSSRMLKNDIMNYSTLLEATAQKVLELSRHTLIPFSLTQHRPRMNEQPLLSVLVNPERSSTEGLN
jgi:hypothetical protein